MNLEQVIKKLPECVFSARDLMKYEITRYHLSLLEKDGVVEKVGHGLFRKVQNSKGSDFDTSGFEKAYAVADKEGYICLWSALYFYDLTEEFVEEAWVMVPYEKIIRRDGVKCVRTRNGDWKHGIVEKTGFKISSIERTIIDSFLNKRHVSLKDAIAMTKLAIKNRKTTISRIVKLATEMGVLTTLKDKLELVT